MSNRIIKVGISQGNINGVGYELILKTFEDDRIFESCIPIIYGSSKILEHHRKMLESPSLDIKNINHPNEAEEIRLNLINCGNDEIKIEFSRKTKESEDASLHALERALKDLIAGHIDVLLTAPTVDDQTGVIESELGKEDKTLKILVYDGFRIALATDNVPFANVSSLLTKELLKDKILALQSSLIHDFMVTLPRIAILSLNSEANLKDNLGKEETEVIVPVIEAASETDICCFGPYAADKFFSSGEYMKFDAVLAMYHDQAYIPFKTITQESGALYLSGLPVIITASSQDIAMGHAGKNLLSPHSFRDALYLSIDLYKNRKWDKKIYANPLRKQYFERSSDNEKLDLTKEED